MARTAQNARKFRSIFGPSQSTPCYYPTHAVSHWCTHVIYRHATSLASLTSSIRDPPPDL
eukprot:12941095-Alexandrium_andersonii.AAC.1